MRKILIRILVLGWFSAIYGMADNNLVLKYDCKQFVMYTHAFLHAQRYVNSDGSITYDAYQFEKNAQNTILQFNSCPLPNPKAIFETLEEEYQRQKSNKNP